MMIQKIGLFLSTAFFVGCATKHDVLKPEMRSPSSQVCRAECIIQDNGWVRSLFRLLGARLGPAEASDFAGLVKQCNQLAGNFIKQNAEALLNKGVPMLFEQNLEDAYVDRLYSSLEITKEGNKEFIHSRSKEANALNSCSGN